MHTTIETRFFDTEGEQHNVETMKNEITPELQGAVDVLLATRNFCGDEAIALLDWQRDFRPLMESERLAVNREVNAQWSDSYREFRGEALRRGF